MSYEVLARKWRPTSFAAMAGQDHVLRALINALAGERLHHAYLFTGTRGVGKTTVARILARCLNCETGVTPEPCGVCTSCREIGEGRFVDLIEVDAASRSRVEETRELLENVQYAPTRGRYKVYLIDEVHMLSGASFNALLKTLEEPPPHVKFLLATTDPKKLPVTVLSRCLQFHLKNLTPDRIVSHLEMVLAEEGISAEGEALWALARAADGSMRDALSLTDQAIAFGDGRLAAEEVARMLGTIDQAALERILEALAVHDGQALLDCCADLAEHAADFAAVLRELMAVLHRIAVVQAVPSAAPSGAGDRIGALVVTMAGRLAAEDIQLYYQIALTGQRDLPFAPDPRSGFEMTLLRMLAFRPDTSGSEERSSHSGSEPVAAGEEAEGSATSVPGAAPVGSAVGAGGRNGRTRSLPVAANAIEVSGAGAGLAESDSLAGELGAETRKATQLHAAPAGDGTASKPEAVSAAPPPLAGPEHWRDVIARLELTGLTAELVNHCLPETVEADRVRLRLDPAAEPLNAEVHVGRLEEALAALRGRSMKVEIRVAVPTDETPAQQAAREKAQRQLEAERAIAADATVRTLIETFDASVQRDSIRPRG